MVKSIEDVIREIIVEHVIPRVKDITVETTKVDYVSFPYYEMNLQDFKNFVKKHNIDDVENYTLTSPYEETTVYATYSVIVPKTENEIYVSKKKRCRNIHFKPMYDNMLAQGFKRVGFNSRLLGQFDDTSVYDMILANNIDRLTQYYRLYFSEPQ